MSDSGKTPEQSAITFLLAEHKYFADSFWKSEEMGEKRLSFFISLMTAVITALVTLHEKSTQPHKKIFIITLFSLTALLTVGILVQLRMRHRNRVSDEYKEKLDYVRSQLNALYPQALENYYPFGKKVEESEKKKSSRSLGRLEIISLALNSVIATAIIVYCLIAWLLP